MKQYRKDNPTKLREWKTTNPEKVRNERNSWARKERARLRGKILDLLGNKCAICGFENPLVLQIDHVNGGGNQEANRFSSNLQYYAFILRQIQKGSKDYQLLCANHNVLKEMERRKNL
jgi:hypothetical protein